MKKKLLLVLVCFLLLLTSCSKSYDFSDLDGVEMDGEIALSLASASYTFVDLLERFKIDSLMNFDEDGGMHFMFNYDLMEVVKGYDLLYFNDIDVEETFSIPNPFPFVLPEPIDTTIFFSQTVTLESNNISVLMAEIRSGRFDFGISSNITNLNQIIIRSSEIKDAEGNDMCLVYNPVLGHESLDLTGLRYQTEVENVLNLIYEVNLTLHDFTQPELSFQTNLHVSDLRVREMIGRISDYKSSFSLDTTFKMFSDKILGTANVCASNIKLRERNGFQLDALLEIDTALVWGEGVVPYHIFGEMPKVVIAPPTHDYIEVLNETLRGKLNMTSNDAYATGIMILNPYGMADIVSVSDTSTVDLKVDVDIPCSFNVESLVYSDTLEFDLANTSLPEIIDEICLDFDFLTDMPFNMNVSAYMYDSVHDVLMDTLAVEEILLGSFDASQVESEIKVQAADERVDKILKSNHIILSFAVDTDSHDVMLYKDQNLFFNMKAIVKYKGNVEFSKSSGE